MPNGRETPDDSGACDHGVPAGRTPPHGARRGPLRPRGRSPMVSETACEEKGRVPGPGGWPS